MTENMINTTINLCTFDSAYAAINDESFGDELKEAYEELQPTQPVALYIGIMVGTILGFTPRELMSDVNEHTVDLITEKSRTMTEIMAPELAEALYNK